MYRSKGFSRMCTEYFDFTDEETRNGMMSLNEDNQSQVMYSLTSKLYDAILEKIDDIDFGTIPMSKGDITKIENFDKITECCSVIENLLEVYKQDKTPILTIMEAIENIKNRREIFERAFKFQVELPMILYSTMVLSIVSSLSFLISSCIEFIKSPSSDSYDIAINKVALVKTKQNLLFENLARFNKCCSSGELDKTMDYIIKSKNNKAFLGIDSLTIASIAIGSAILFNIIPIMRELIYFFYYSRVRISDYFEIQADLLQINAHNIEVVGNPEEKKRAKETKDKQMKIASTFRKIADKISISSKDAQKKSEKDLKAEAKNKVKMKDVVGKDQMPDSAASSLF